MRVALFSNPRSGAGDADRVAELLDAQVTRLDFEAVCEGSVREVDADRIVVAGGDGSLGPAALLALRAGLPLAVVPAGTANSFARWLGLPLDVDEATRLAGREDAVTMTAEVASADGRPFVNVASTGLAVLAAHGARPLKPKLGPLAYAAGAVKAGPRRRLVRHAFAMSRGRLVREDDVPHVRGRVVDLDLPGGTEFNVDGEILRLERPRFEVLGTIEVVAA